MNSYTPTKKTIIFSLSAGSISLILFFIFVSSIFGKINTLNQQVSATQMYNANIDNALRFKKEESDLSAQITTIEAFFVKPGEEPYFVEKVENLGRAMGVKVETDSITEGKLKNGYKTLSVNLKYEGSVKSIISFLHKAENMPYAVSIDNVDMNISESGDSWSGSATLTAYKAKDQ